jgi:hypothetical protein
MPAIAVLRSASRAWSSAATRPSSHARARREGQLALVDEAVAGASAGERGVEAGEGGRPLARSAPQPLDVPRAAATSPWSASTRARSLGDLARRE